MSATKSKIDGFEKFNEHTEIEVTDHIVDGDGEYTSLVVTLPDGVTFEVDLSETSDGVSVDGAAVNRS